MTDKQRTQLNEKRWELECNLKILKELMEEIKRQEETVKQSQATVNELEKQ